MKRNRLSDQIANQLEEMIADGTLKPGERLPGERQLAERLEISRPSLREAIQKLASKGLINTRQGGGTYISTDLTSDFTNPLISLLMNRKDAEFDTLEVRQELEGMAAYHAATRATDNDRAKILEAFNTTAEIHRSNASSIDKLRSDFDFHFSIIEAAHNIVLTHFMRGLKDVMESTVSSYLDQFYAEEEFVEKLCQQHKKIVDAIMQHDPKAARAAAMQHLDFAYQSFRDFQAKNKISKNARFYSSMYDKKSNLKESAK